ncbi:hypothetical protein TTHERM_000699759 (macronuclear) [Tetrahymena thermophila SB210]|uniref:Uncharacterized protein n=1 Tax=Tetrahymena thermophila (strain SB210) TaxID=312017 RepID=W7XLQ5_TETTS|nr:hypothetical protein TTHERM_000699759 [Tetrahymena thermophila SB210]EWS76699.1 hypothetical protein TTHERM_000699759 [Tetrahymena thermophila SB210]|eukprot:XP_012650769.1 hypothetical protein TTHERM_000699759 [Tetrahymena thermophila SB210]
MQNDFINSMKTISVKKDTINRIINQFDSLGVLPLDTAKITQQQIKLIPIYKIRDKVLPIEPFLNVNITPKKATFINELLIMAISICQINILYPQNNIEITNVCIVFKQSRVNLNGRQRIPSKMQKILKNQ